VLERGHRLDKASRQVALDPETVRLYVHDRVGRSVSRANVRKRIAKPFHVHAMLTNRTGTRRVVAFVQSFSPQASLLEAS